MTENGERPSEHQAYQEQWQKRDERFEQISRRAGKFLRQDVDEVYVDEAGNRVAYLMGWSTEHGRRGIFRLSDACDELRLEFLELDSELPRPIDSSVHITVAREHANTAFAHNVNDAAGLTDGDLELAKMLLGNASYIDRQRYRELAG